jgi:hypothetical protein
MITAGDRGYAAWRDGGFTIHDISDPTNPKLLSHINWSPPFAGGTHTPLPLPKRQLAIVADEANADQCAKGLFHTFVLDVRAPENPVPIATLPTPRDRDFCTNGTFGPHNLHENRPGSFQSEETIFATSMPACGCSTSGTPLRRRSSPTGCRRHRRSSSTPARMSRSRRRHVTPMSGLTA